MTTPILCKPRGALFTKAEQKFLDALDAISGDAFRVFGKVWVSDILMPSVKRLDQNEIESLYSGANSAIWYSHNYAALLAKNKVRVSIAVDNWRKQNIR